MCCLLFLLREPQDSPWGPQRPQESPGEASGDPPHLKSVEDCRWLLNVVKAQVFCYRLGYSDQICKMDTILICIFARQGRQRAPTHRYVLSYHPRFSRLHHTPRLSKSSAIRRLSIREINHIQHCEHAFSCFSVHAPHWKNVTSSWRNKGSHNVVCTVSLLWSTH